MHSCPWGGAPRIRVSNAQDRYWSGTAFADHSKLSKSINQWNKQQKKIQILSLIIPVLLKFLDPHCGMCGKIPSCQRPLRPMHAAGQGWGWGHSRCVSWISSQMFSKRVMENVCTPGQTAVQSPLTALRSKPVMLLERECYPT